MYAILAVLFCFHDPIVWHYYYLFDAAFFMNFHLYKTVSNIGVINKCCGADVIVFVKAKVFFAINKGVHRVDFGWCIGIITSCYCLYYLVTKLLENYFCNNKEDCYNYYYEDGYKIYSDMENTERNFSLAIIPLIEVMLSGNSNTTCRMLRKNNTIYPVL